MEGYFLLSLYVLKCIIISRTTQCPKAVTINLDTIVFKIALMYINLCVTIYNFPMYNTQYALDLHFLAIVSRREKFFKTRHCTELNQIMQAGTNINCQKEVLEGSC